MTVTGKTYLDGRKLTIFDPTGETASVTIDNPEADATHLKTLLDIQFFL